MQMPGRNGKAVTGGGWAQGSTKVNGATVSETLVIDSRTENTPSEYKAATSIEFTDGFTSGSTDEFIAQIADANNTTTTGSGTGNSASGVSGYRYGFNGKELDNDIASDDYDYGARIYDGRIGRWLSLDPLQKKYPNESPYLFAGGNPILFLDPDGKDRITMVWIYVGGTFMPLVKKVVKAEYIVKATQNGFMAYDSYNVTIFGSDGNVWRHTESLEFAKKATWGDWIVGKLGNKKLVSDKPVQDSGPGSDQKGGYILTGNPNGENIDFKDKGGVVYGHIDMGMLLKIFGAVNSEGGEALLKKMDQSALKVFVAALEKGKFAKDAKENAEALYESAKDLIKTYKDNNNEKNFEPNSIICRDCGQKPHVEDGTPALKIGKNGEVTDTIKKNDKTGKIDTIPTKKN